MKKKPNKNIINKPLNLDWSTLLQHEDVDPPELLIIFKPAPKNPSSLADIEHTTVTMDEIFIQSLTDRELEDSMLRKTRLLEKLGANCPDGGLKLSTTIERLRREKEKRFRRRITKENGELEKPAQCSSLIANVVSSILPFDSRRMTYSVHKNEMVCVVKSGSDERSENASLENHSPPSAKDLTNTTEESKDCRTSNAFETEMEVMSGGNSQHKVKSKRKLSPRSCQNAGISSGEWPPPLSGKASSMCEKKPPFDSDPSMSCPIPKMKDNHQFQLRSYNLRAKKKKNVVLLDDEECQLIETPRELAEDAKFLKEARIYYPSREDRESVEICYSDLDCLAPEGFLTSPIMNFYILYLQYQAFMTNSTICDYHIFNTFFYTKLQDAVLAQDNDRDMFAKFRKWWRNVCLFQKAYILIPIHEDLHWSLAIICIPDKDDESGPIILHLDSLRLHRSKLVFKNIKRLLILEWSYLNGEIAQVDLPIAQSIWESLPKQIEEKTIAVPQQKNDCDCGLFVLYFMERFLEDAPERLRKKDLALFGKRWFEPEEASGLRMKIRDLLVEEFQKVTESS